MSKSTSHHAADAITPEHRAAYEADGVVKIAGAVAGEYPAGDDRFPLVAA